jgi:hypothetical protein
MTDGWEALLEAGVPFGAARPPPTAMPRGRVREAVASAEDLLAQLSIPQREALYAWLRAYQAHWPKGFERVLGAPGTRLLALLDREGPRDPNRYLKLRRIALENLSKVA